jgi:phage gpG-like protein
MAGRHLSPEAVARKGADTPLLETGELRDSIEGNADSHEAYIGSNHDCAVFQEMGTATIPPRPFLTAAAMHKRQEVADAIGEHIVKVLLPK